MSLADDLKDLKEDLKNCDEDEKEELKAEILRLETLKNPEWFRCGLCDGNGFFKEWEHSYRCALCKGKGGNWSGV